MKNLLIFFLLVFLGGCTVESMNLPVDDASRFTIQPITRVSAVGPIAISRGGQRLAWSDSGLHLTEIESGRQRLLLDAQVDALCWSPDGSMLATAALVDKKSHLYVFNQSGIRLYDQQLTGRAFRLQWPASGSLTAGILTVKTYSFGTHISGNLLRWDDQWQVTDQPLFETTIKPGTAKRLRGKLFRTFDFDLSPLDDEVLYTRLHAPPAFAASRRLILRNFQTEEEHQLSVLPLLGGEGRLLADGDSVLVADGLNQIQMRLLWSKHLQKFWSGKYFDFDASSGLLIIDNQLYQGERLLVKLPVGSKAQLSPGGRYLLVRWKGVVYLLTGYPVAETQRISGIKLKKLQKLRRIRSRGLIEQSEYLQTKERLLQ